MVEDSGEGAELQQRQPSCIIIAGPNGAGKTIFAREFLPREGSCPIYVNADLIAEGLSPFDPGMVDIRAGRLMLEEIAFHCQKDPSLAILGLSGQIDLSVPD